MAKRIKHETHVVLLGLVVCLPSFVATGILLWLGDYSSNLRWLVVCVLVVWLAIGLAALRHRIRFPLQTLANLLSAIREGDFSTRARGSRRDDALGELASEVNTLAAGLREQRLDSMEASALLRTVMAEIDVALFAFDANSRLTLVNRTGERVLGRRSEHLLARTASELGLADCLSGEANRTLDRAIPGGGDRWSLRRGTFRQGGQRHSLVILTDLSRALRDEERLAWRRLLRVLGHELNNSLAPIKSIAGSLEKLLTSESKASDWEQDLRQGISIISSRTAALTKFMEDYSRLAKLPPPTIQSIALEPLLRRVASFELRAPVQLKMGPALQLRADPVQLEQLLINLVRNAVDATVAQPSLSSSAGAVGTENPSLVTVSWKASDREVEICVEDNGPGISSAANLFVPFFTTKPGGSGIGLVFCRQIAEAHGGALTLENRVNQSGCVARLRLPRGG